MSDYRADPEDILSGLEKTYNHFQEETWPDPEVKSARIHIMKDADIEEEEALKIVDRLVQEDYIELQDEGSVEDEETKLRKVKVEKFKQDIDYCEPFVLPEDLDQPRNSQVAHYFTPWLIENHDVRSVLLDLERNSYELWSYDPQSKTWKTNGLQKLLDIAPKQLGERYSKSLRKEIQERLKTQKVIYYSETGADKGEVAVENGILDLENNHVRDIEREDYITSKIPVKFEGGFETPDLWEEYLEDVVPSEQARDTLQEFAGYCLMPWTAKYERGLMLLGPTDSGKSVFLDVMRELLGGEDNVSQESLQNLANTRWGVASLKGKLANIDHDLDPKSIEDVGTVKKLTSGNEMMAERKKEKKFGIKPTAKLMFSANRVPDRNKEDDAFYNRWLTVTFPETIPDEEQDPDLVDKLTDEENLRGILRWAIAGQKRLEQEQAFTGDLDPLATKELWKEWGNSVERFVSRYCVKEKEVPEDQREEMDFKIHFDTLYSLYEEFARINGFEKESKKGFTQKLRKDPQIRKGRPSVGGKQERGFFGITMEEEAYKSLKDGEKVEDEWAE